MDIMTTARQQKKPLDRTLDRDLKNISVFFQDLRKDKSLPDFSDFFVKCVLFGIGERVNLKALYPRQYKKVSTFVQKHNATIQALQEKK